MTNPSLNALKGYSFQAIVFIYLVLYYDAHRGFKCVSAEKKHDDNFDDIEICDNNDFLYRIQVKNLEQIAKIKIDNEVIKIDNRKILKNTNARNILILNKCEYKSEYEHNDKIFGMSAFFGDNTYFVYISIEEICGLIEQLYINNESRLKQMLLFASKKVTSSENKIEIDELPKLSFFSHKLLDATINIRKFNTNTKDNILFIVGKPGVGKSHLVNEIITDNSILYRFWINEQDSTKLERLKYDYFFRELREKLFYNSTNRTEEEVVLKLVAENKILLLDGFDHIENYNKDDLGKFKNFIGQFDSIPNAKIIVFTRPLKCETNWSHKELGNWTEQETQEFILKKFLIEDCFISKQIFKISKGYPIICNFLTQHYKTKGTLPEYNEIDNLFEYYDNLIRDIKIKSCLKVFTTNTSYFSIQELKAILVESFSIIEEFMAEYPYLFEKRMNRISLIHDSLNLYLRQDISHLDMEKKVIEYVEQSIDLCEVRFLSRFDNFSLSDEFKKKTLLKYSKFEVLMNLINTNIDIESICAFYPKLQKVIKEHGAEIFDIYQYYEYILIISVLCRCSDNMASQYGLIYNKLCYLKNNAIEIEDNIYSEGEIFKTYYLYETDKDSLFRSSHSKFEADKTVQSINDQLTREHYFYKNIENFNSYDEILNSIYDLNNKNDYEKHFDIAKLMAYSYINKIKIEFFSQLFESFLFGDREIAIRLLEEKFPELGIRKIMAQWSLNKAKNILYEYGLLRDSNEYIIKNFDDFITEVSSRGSFATVDEINKYIRLAIKENRKINIYSINKYYLMYHNRKDSTVHTLPIALDVLKKLNFLNNEKAINIIASAQSLSEKGIRHILSEYLNMLDVEELAVVNNLNIFAPEAEYEVFINHCNVQVINIIKEEHAICKLHKQVGRKRESLNYDDYDNIMKSKYRNYIIEFSKLHSYKLYNVPPEEKLSDFDGLEFTLKDNQQHKDEYIPGASYEKGYLDIKDFNYIKGVGISHIDLSKMLDGWYSKFAILALYDMFDKKVLKRDFLKIIYTTLIEGKTSFGSPGIYHHYLGNILKFAYDLELEIDWNRMYLILNSFLKASLIIK